MPTIQQLVRKSMASQLKISESKIYRIINDFKSEQQIEQQTSNQNSLISILNWDKYQQSEQQNEQQMNNERTTDEQPVNTNKNVKNVKNERNNNIYAKANPKSDRSKYIFKYLPNFPYRYEFSATPADKPEKLYSKLAWF